ncbi:Sua5/YciO/YrdC/YwlC family protein [Sulfurospirillum sp. 1612]|uniref:Sua5/YciO/YrdC/YwlC family protein n=1 Tax=Sulfurospirillum sp. 1612 TaxID=3094835 RepID=UPI002F948C00
MNPTQVYLTQTDTTVGFLSQNSTQLAQIKQRDKKKPFLMSVDSLRTLKTLTRVRNIHKKMIRRATKTTFVFSNTLAIRVVKDPTHLRFLKKIKWAYSTSSNASGQAFDLPFALRHADVILYTKSGFEEKEASCIIKCGRISKRRLR